MRISSLRLFHHGARTIAMLLVATVGLSLSGCSGGGGGGTTAPTLSRVDVTPASPSVAAGNDQPFAATAVFSDGSTRTVTNTATWSSSDTGIATIDASGLAHSIAKGTTTIQATYSGHNGSTVLTVTDPVLTRIDVTPTNPSIPAGATQSFVATGTYTDLSTQDLSSVATWASSNPAFIDISNAAGSEGVATAVSPGTATITATYQGVSGSTSATATDAVLSSIQVTPASSKLAEGFSLQYTATGTYTDSSTHDLTATVTWTSSAPSRADFTTSTAPGLITAATSPGSTLVTATSGSVSGSTPLTVTNATLSSIAVTPAAPTIPKGTNQQFAATGTFSDNTTQDLTSQANWQSAAPAVATVGNADANGAKGFAKSVSAGSASISAGISNATTSMSGATTLTVTAAALTAISVTPNPASTPKGVPLQFQAFGTYTDGSTGVDITKSVTWNSSNTGVATISNDAGHTLPPPATTDTRGLATPVATGTTTITASATGNGGATISGTSTLTVTAALLRSISVTSPDASVVAGRSEQFTATGTYSDNTTQNITNSVTWDTTNHSVATVSSASPDWGKATTYASGSIQVTASKDDGAGNTIGANKSFSVTAAVPQTIAVTPANASYPVNSKDIQYTAHEAFSDGTNPDVTQQVTWSSSDTTVATVANDGTNKGKVTTTSKAGSATITATDSSVSPNIVGSTTITVTAATLTTITVSVVGPGDGHVPLGYKQQYTALGHYADGGSGFNQDVTNSVAWSVQNPAIAAVSNTAGSKGVVNGVAPGSTNVIAALNGVSGSAGIIVTSATLSSIDVNPKNATIHGSGTTLQYGAVGTFSDASQLDITTQVAWSSSNTNAVTINASSGLATGGIVPGNSTITASKGSPAITGQTTATLAIP